MDWHRAALAPDLSELSTYEVQQSFYEAPTSKQVELPCPSCGSNMIPISGTNQVHCTRCKGVFIDHAAN